MIKANELRRGNWFNDVRGNGYDAPGFQQVRIIGSRGVNEWSDMGADGYSKYEDIEPIPLTPEILEKCGFEGKVLVMQDISLYFFLNDNGYVYLECHLTAPEQFNLTLTDKLMVVFYVHQLQNLYFALTGEELNVNLKNSSYDLKTNLPYPFGKTVEK